MPGLAAAAHRKPLEQRHNDCDDRRAYWLTQGLDASLRDLLTVASDAEAARFWQQAETAFRPILAAAFVAKFTQAVAGKLPLVQAA